MSRSDTVVVIILDIFSSLLLALLILYHSVTFLCKPEFLLFCLTFKIFSTVLFVFQSMTAVYSKTGGGREGVSEERGV